MAGAYECDRCGKLYIEDHIGSKFIHLEYRSDREVPLNYICIKALGQLFTKDLCPDCYDDFCEWYNEPRKESKNDKN